MISTFFPGREVKYLKKFSRHVQKGHLRITFCDPNIQVSTSLSSIFEAMPAVAVAYGNALKVKADAIVSPTNSFGDMSGGMDKHIDDFCKGKAQSKAMEHIRRYYLGELPVGVALILHMNQKRFPFIVIAPTMRIPGNVCGTINAYLAMRATLVATIKHNKSEKEKSGISLFRVFVPALEECPMRIHPNKC